MIRETSCHEERGRETWRSKTCKSEWIFKSINWCCRVNELIWDEVRFILYQRGDVPSDKVRVTDERAGRRYFLWMVCFLSPSWSTWFTFAFTLRRQSGQGAGKQMNSVTWREACSWNMKTSRRECDGQGEEASRGVESKRKKKQKKTYKHSSTWGKYFVCLCSLHVNQARDCWQANLMQVSVTEKKEREKNSDGKHVRSQLAR